MAYNKDNLIPIPDTFKDRDMGWMGDLPVSDHPWVMRRFGDAVFLSNPDHPPHTVIDGKLAKIEMSWDVGVEVKPQWWF